MRTSTLFIPTACLLGLSLASGIHASTKRQSAQPYTWSILWQETTVCQSWPCEYAFLVEGPDYTVEPFGWIPRFLAHCEGTVDQPTAACLVATPTQEDGGLPYPEQHVVGNFSTYETSGVANGEIVVEYLFYSVELGENIALGLSTPLQGTNWTDTPSGIPVASVVYAQPEKN